MVIFHSYVSLPEGKYEDICQLAGKWDLSENFGSPKSNGSSMGVHPKMDALWWEILLNIQKCVDRFLFIS
jgi:hypothetical protein